MSKRLKLAVWKFSSCDGCQLQLLDLGENLLALLGQVEIAWFLEASRRTISGPYDLSLVEGSVTTPREEKEIRRIRKASRHLVTIGACATAGGIQALRNFASLENYAALVYPQPEYITALATCMPASHYVKVDAELHGCPINREQVLEVIVALLLGRKAHLPESSVCMECKRAHHSCVLVEHGTPCLGPVTRAGCGAICPGFKRGCYGCFGPVPGANLASHARVLQELGVDTKGWRRMLSTFNVQAFRALEETNGGNKDEKTAHD